MRLWKRNAIDTEGQEEAPLVALGGGGRRSGIRDEGGDDRETSQRMLL